MANTDNDDKSKATPPPAVVKAEKAKIGPEWVTIYNPETKATAKVHRRSVPHYVNDDMPWEIKEADKK